MSKQNDPRKISMNPRPEMSRDQFVQAMANSKRRISQTKGELFDAIGDKITSEMAGMASACNQLYDQLEFKTAENQQLKLNVEELKKKLEKYEPKSTVKKTGTGETSIPPKDPPK